MNAKNLKNDAALAASMTDEEIIAAAVSDPDNAPMTAAQLARMQPVSAAKRTRRKLGLSQEEFAQRFGIPLGTLRDWEQHRREPDQAAQAYLTVIEREHTAVERALAVGVTSRPGLC